MKPGKRILSLVLALVMVFGLTTGASAADTQNVTVQLSPNITVKYNGTVQNMADVDGNPVYPLLYDGTTYLPIRAVSNMLGVYVDWDGDTQTVKLIDATNSTGPATSTSNSTKKPDTQNVTVQLSPNITVTYFSTVQKMTDVNGNAVYPLLYDGTTYLPIRAVSNILGVEVDWDGSTQTVILTYDPYKGMTVDEYLEANKDGFTFDDMTVDEYIAYHIESGENANEVKEKIASRIARMKVWTEQRFESYRNDPMSFYTTSEDAEVLGEKHIGYDWAEIDWSTADDGYIRVKINDQNGSYTYCQIYWNKGTSSTGTLLHASRDIISIEGEWVNIPITGDSTDFAVQIESEATHKALSKVVTLEDINKAVDPKHPTLTVRFTGKPISDETRWLLSYDLVNYENAPLTCAKALEITENCKSDAEKITAVFNWVANNITYDNQEWAKRQATTIERKKAQASGTYVPYEDEPRSADMELDNILTSKKGVCEHYAILMAAMLRSLGIPCKVVSGEVYSGRTIEGYNDDNPGWVGHAWVAVSPDVKGLNMSALGAGKDFETEFKNLELVNTNDTGWIRLDPTNAKDKSFTSNDSKYRALSYY